MPKLIDDYMKYSFYMDCSNYMKTLSSIVLMFSVVIDIYFMLYVSEIETKPV